jgi:molybdate transport system substrate-binding protein
MWAASVSTLLLLNLSVLLSSTIAASDSSILVAAAADLEPLQNQLAVAFRQAGGSAVKFTLGASGSLAQQIENGAPYDVYLSANESFVKRLADSGRLRADTVQVYAVGRIALWSKSGRVRTMEDLAQPAVRHVAIANPAHAPYGMAARDALKNKGLWDKIEPKLVYGENVQQAFQYAASGNADAVILAWSLVIDKGGVLLSAALHAPIRQSGGVVASSKNGGTARKFMDLLASPAGRAILRQFGFDRPN